MLILGLLVPIIGIWSGAYLLNSANKTLYHVRWFLLTVSVGLVVGGLANSATYMLDSKTKAFGFPLIYTVFQQDEDGRWLDYVGWMTPVGWIGNLLNGLALPHILLAFRVCLKKRALKSSP
jgi:hypothetical protein